MKEEQTTIDFSQQLPQQVRFYKPQNSMNKAMERLCSEGKAWYVRKRNGEMMSCVKHSDGAWRMYSSKMLLTHKNEPGVPWSDRFPHIIADLDSLDVPNGTVLLGELVAGRRVDSLEQVGSLTKSLGDVALDFQKERPGHLCVWDIAVYGGEYWCVEKPYRSRFYKMSELFGDPFCLPTYKFEYLCMPETYAAPECRDYEEMRQLAKEKGWEGFVVIDPETPYGEKGVNFRGKHERPITCCKLKPKLEADFIVRWDPANGIGRWGKGKKQNGVGSVEAYLIDQHTGEEVLIARVGGGLSDENVHKFADPSLYPMVWEVAFDSWTAKGSIQFPEFVRVRHDKTPEECTMESVLVD